MSKTVCPPRPDALGSHTHSAHAAATAASMALPPTRSISSPASVASGNAVATASASPCSDARAFAIKFWPVASILRVSISAFRHIVQPAGAFDIRPGKDLADLFAGLVLMITHVHALILADVQDLDLPGVMGHDVFERLLDPAQALTDAAGDLDSSPQRNLKMGGGLNRSSLEQVVGTDADLVALGERCREYVGIVVHLGEKHRLIEKLHARATHVANAALRFFGNLADMIEMCHNHRGLSGIENAFEQSGKRRVLEAFGRKGNGLRAETQRTQVWNRQQVIENLVELVGAQHEWIAARHQDVVHFRMATDVIRHLGVIRCDFIRIVADDALAEAIAAV